MSSKYPRTYHLPFSPEIHSDDKTIAKEYLNNFLNRRVIITEKLDGGNCCYRDRVVYARTHTTPAVHPSFDPIKNMFAGLQYLIDPSESVFGENLYGIHSIEYDNLDSPFYVFNILNDVWLSWDDVKIKCDNYGLKCVPELFDGNFKTISEIQQFMDSEIKNPSALGKEREGFVIRIADAFTDFEKCAAKYVRKDHVQSDERWEVNWRAAKLKK